MTLAAHVPRLVIAALRGDSGKTVLSMGLIGSWRRRGHDVYPFKKGPDYIDAAWHSVAASRPCRSLDTFMLGRERAAQSFWSHAAPDGIAIVEGNRGLFDGVDVEGTHSTAELAKLIQAPVVLALDCYKATRTMAAAVLGCQRLDPDLSIAGVVLNRVAGTRHERIIRSAIEATCRLPVFGAIPRDSILDLPQRHLGLVPPPEHALVERAVGQAADLIEKHVDLDGIWRAAHAAPPVHVEREAEPATSSARRFTIGVIRDAAFQFYYPENLEALEHEGARIVELSALRDHSLPDLDGLYIGGGFPEAHAEALANNRSFAEGLRAAIDDGLPVLAECAGMMYLGRSLTWHGKTYNMVGALPLAFVMESRPHGHGYTIIEADAANPFFPPGALLRGHEFHYSRLDEPRCGDVETAFQVQRGHCLDGQRDGIVYRNVLATYSHVHALAAPEWAQCFVAAALRYSGTPGA